LLFSLIVLRPRDLTLVLEFGYSLPSIH